MIVYLYLQVKPLTQIKFNSVLSEDLRAIGFDITQIDLDSHSEAFTVNRSIESIPHAEKLILHIDAESSEVLGALKPVFEKLRKFTQPVLCLRQGEHGPTDKMLKLLKIDSHPIKAPVDSIDLVTEFLAN